MQYIYYKHWCTMRLGAIKVLRNAVGGGRLSDFLENIVTKIYGSTLLALRGCGLVSNFLKEKT